MEVAQPGDDGHPATHGDLVAEKAAEEMRSIVETKERDAALDTKACLLLDLCHDAFLARVKQWQERNHLASTTVVRKTRLGGVFAL